VAKNSLLKTRKSGSVQAYEPAHFDSGSVVFNRGDQLKSALDKIAKIESDAFDKGYAEGIAAGSQTVQETARRLAAVIMELEQWRDKKSLELVPDLIDLSIGIAKKIIHANIEKDRENIIEVVREALAKLGGREEKITIRVNPGDYDTMLSSLEVLREETRLRDITIEPASAISPGGCFIETPSGEVDARIEEMLKEIRDAIGTAINS
jgi:flagellar assembly protein FliH